MIVRKKLIITVVLIVAAVSVFAQPGTEIYLFELKVGRGKVTIDNPRNISNRKGYDNQPYFHPDKPLIYYSSADDEGRTDIREYNLTNGQSRKITQTHDREYSPRTTPDKNFISCILQRDSGAQDLVRYPVNGGDAEVIIGNHIVGYHTWVNQSTVAIFTLPQPFMLRLVDTRTGKDTVVADRIGRSIHQIPGRNAVSYIKKLNDTEWMIMALDVGTMASTPVIQTLPGREKDMAWTPGGLILMSDEKKIYYFRPGSEGGWKEVEMKSDVPPGTVTRLAVSPDGKKIAVVVNE